MLVRSCPAGSQSWLLRRPAGRCSRYQHCRTGHGMPPAQTTAQRAAKAQRAAEMRVVEAVEAEVAWVVGVGAFPAAEWAVQAEASQL